MTQKYIVEVNEKGEMVGQAVPYTETASTIEKAPQTISTTYMWGSTFLVLLVILSVLIVGLKLVLQKDK